MFLDHVELGLDQRIALPRDSYLIQYFNEFEEYFKVGPPVYFMVRDVDATDTDGQSALCARAMGCDTWSAANVLEMERKRPTVSYIAQPTASWIDDLFMWLNPANTNCCRFKKSAPTELCDPYDWPDDCDMCIREEEYYNALTALPKGKKFMDLLGYFLTAKPSAECPLAGSAAYDDALLRNTTHVEASHFRTYHTVLRTQSDFIEAYRSALDIARDIQERSENPRLKVIPYSVFYIFFEQVCRMELMETNVHKFVSSHLFSTCI